MRLLSRVLLALTLLGLLSLAVILSDWLPRTSEREQAAMEALQSDLAQTRGQRNAADYLRLAAFDLDADLIATISAEDRAVRSQSRRVAEDDYAFTVAEGRYPKLAPWPQTDWECEVWPEVDDQGCLPRVRSREVEARAMLAEHNRWLAIETGLIDFDHVRADMQLALIPMGPPSTGKPVALAAALQHIDGDTAGALDRLCIHITSWRQLRAQSNNLITDMLGIAIINRLLRLAAEIAAEVPDLPRPDSCAAALSLLEDDELLQCRAFAGEHELWQALLSGATEEELLLDTPWKALFWNPRHTRALVALQPALFCQTTHADRVARRSLEPPMPGFSCDGWQRAFNSSGCIVLNGSNSNDRYYHRVLDLDARFRLFQLADWIRSQDGHADVSALLAEMPQELRNPAYRFELDAEHDLLRVSQVDTGHGQWWSLPLWPAASRPEH